MDTERITEIRDDLFRIAGIPDDPEALEQRAKDHVTTLDALKSAKAINAQLLTSCEEMLKDLGIERKLRAAIARAKGETNE